MKRKYEVNLLEIQDAHALPGVWTEPTFRELLDLLNYGDTSSLPSHEVKEMTLMALADLEPPDAAEVLLEMRIGDELSQGLRRELSTDIRNQRLWEDYSGMGLHEEIFNVTALLHMAFPRKFREPDIAAVKLSVKALNSASADNLETPTVSFFARLINDCMDENNLIFRLFDDQLLADEFPDAANLIWEILPEAMDSAALSRTFTLFISWKWVDQLKGLASSMPLEFQTNAYSDGQLDDAG